MYTKIFISMLLLIIKEPPVRIMLFYTCSRKNEWNSKKKNNIYPIIQVQEGKIVVNIFTRLKIFFVLFKLSLMLHSQCSFLRSSNLTSLPKPTSMITKTPEKIYNFMKNTWCEFYKFKVASKLLKLGFVALCWDFELWISQPIEGNENEVYKLWNSECHTVIVWLNF